MLKNSKLESLTNKVSVVLFVLGITLAILGYANQSQQINNSSQLNQINSPDFSLSN